MTTPLTPDELAALRERHVEADGECRSWRCNGLWPCMTARLLATLDAQTLDVERLRRLAEAAAVLAIEAEARAAVIAEVRAAVEGLGGIPFFRPPDALRPHAEVLDLLDRLEGR